MAHVTVPDVPTRQSYTVGGTPQSAFSIPFSFFDPTDIVVYVGGILKTYATDYSVSGVAVDGGYSGGTATLTVAVANTTVVVQRDTPTARTEDFPYPSSTLNIKALNTALDKIAAWAQQLKAKASRALRQPDADTADIGQLPAKTLRANTALIFDANGDPAVGVTPGLTLPVPIAQGGTGQTTADAAVYALIASATNDTAPNIANDKIGWAKASGTTGRSMSFQALWNLLNSLTAYTTLNGADEIALRDGSGGGNGVRKMTVANFLTGYGYQGRNIAGRNGGLEVWQRGAGGSPASFAVPASTTQYTADGWAIKTNANQACTVTQTARSGVGSRWAARIQRNNGQTGVGTLSFEFPLDTDEIVAMQGKTVSLGLDIQTGANWSPTSGNLTVELRTGTGSPAKRSAGAYTGDAAPIAATIALTAGGAIARFTPATNAGLTGTIGGTVTQASIYITWTPTGTAGVNDWVLIDDVQLEISPIATPFERRPFEVELRACQRHYWKSFAYATAPAQNVGINTGCLVQLAIAAGANAQVFPIRWPVQMRVAPSVTTFNPAASNAQIRDVSTSTDGASTTAVNLTTEGGAITAVGNAGSGVTSQMQVHATFDAGI